PRMGSVILIVPSEATERALFTRTLSDHHLVFAADGEDAYNRFSEVKPNLVIMPLALPNLDAKLLIPLLREQTNGEKTPMVLLAGDMPKARATSLGADEIITLPLDETKIEQKLGPILARQPRPITITEQSEWVQPPPSPSEAENTVVGAPNPYSDGRTEVELV